MMEKHEPFASENHRKCCRAFRLGRGIVLLMILKAEFSQGLPEVKLTTIRNSRYALVLRCSFEWKLAYFIQWKKDNKQICSYNKTNPTPECNSPHLKLTNVHENYQELIIGDKFKNDTGEYLCSVFDVASEKSAKLTITDTYNTTYFFISSNGRILSNVSCSQNNIPERDSDPSFNYTCSSSGYPTSRLPSPLMNIQKNAPKLRIECKWILQFGTVTETKRICLHVRVTVPAQSNNSQLIALIIGWCIAVLSTILIFGTIARIVYYKCRKYLGEMSKRSKEEVNLLPAEGADIAPGEEKVKSLSGAGNIPGKQTPHGAGTIQKNIEMSKRSKEEVSLLPAEEADIASGKEKVKSPSGAGNITGEGDSTDAHVSLLTDQIASQIKAGLDIKPIHHATPETESQPQRQPEDKEAMVRKERMERYKDFLKTYREDFTSTLTLKGQLLNKLVGKEVISKTQLESIETTAGIDQNRAGVLLNTLESRTVGEVENFFKVLKQDEDETGAAEIIKKLHPEDYKRLFPDIA